MADNSQNTKPRKGRAKADDSAGMAEAESALTEHGLKSGIGDNGAPDGEHNAAKEPGPGEIEAALSDLGEAVAREAGNYDLSEEAHHSAIEQAEDAASNAVLSAPSLVWDTRDFLLEQIKRRPKPWGGCSGGEQRDIAAACEHAAQQLVSKIAETMATQGQPSVRVLVGQVVLGDDIKVTGKVKFQGDEDEDAGVLFLHRAQGQFVMMTLASKDVHQEGGRPAPGVPEEEPALPFEAGADEIPDDDSDLVEAAEGDAAARREAVERSGIVIKVETDPLRTGDLIDNDDYGVVRVRINLQTGMIEGQTPLQDDWNIDVRQATPNELAGERNRVADFDAAERETEEEPEPAD